MTVAHKLAGILATTALTALAVAAFLWPDRRPPPEPLALAVSQGKVGLPLRMADRQGFFAAEGLAVAFKRQPTGKAALEAMLRGEAQIATVAEGPIMFAGLAGKPVRVIANYAASDEHSVVARADRGIRRVTDLPGRRIGLSLGTTAHYFLHVLLSDQGLAESAVDLVDLPTPELATALAAGRVDAVSTFAPYSTQCRRALGDKAQRFPAGIRYSGFASLVATPDFLRQRPEVALRLLRATDRTIAWMRGHREEAIALAAGEMDFDRSDLEETWDRVWPNLAIDQGFVVLLQAQARWAIETGLAPGTSPPDYRGLIDASLLARLHPEAVPPIPRP